MSCCSDVMEPIETSSCCTPKDTADDRKASAVRVADIMRPSLHEHRATSLPVVDEAGGCCGIVSAHRLEKR